MKGNLVGRVVGFSFPYRLDPSQVEPGESLEAERTIWGVVREHRPDWQSTIIDSLHERGQGYICPEERIHTTMPQGYLTSTPRSYVRF